MTTKEKSRGDVLASFDIGQEKARHRDMQHSKGVKSGLLLVFILVIAIIGIASTQMAQAKTIDKNDGPWIVKANGEEICYVHERADGEQIVLGLKMKYCGTVAAQQQAEVKDFVTIERAPMGAYQANDILDANQAVSYISGLNKEVDPPITISIKKIVEEEKIVKHKVKVIDSEDVIKGQAEVKQEGKDGSRHVTSDVVMENGEYTESTELDSEVIEEAVEAVVYKGTKLSAEEKGELLVDYAVNFLGTPYKWGGSDLRKGTDCSGFTMSLYGDVGITLPHYSEDQVNCGTEVSLDEARAGDIVCYKGHVALYIGEGKIIHATGNRVQFRDSADYKKIVSIRRIFTDDDNVSWDQFEELLKTTPNDNAEAKAAVAERAEQREKREKAQDKATKELIEEAGK